MAHEGGTLFVVVESAKVRGGAGAAALLVVHGLVAVVVMPACWGRLVLVRTHAAGCCGRGLLVLHDACLRRPWCTPCERCRACRTGTFLGSRWVAVGSASGAVKPVRPWVGPCLPVVWAMLHATYRLDPPSTAGSWGFSVRDGGRACTRVPEPPCHATPPPPRPASQDPYCVVKCGGQTFKTKVAKDGGKNPQWNDTFSMAIVSQWNNSTASRHAAKWGTCMQHAQLLHRVLVLACVQATCRQSIPSAHDVTSTRVVPAGVPLHGKQ